MNGTDCRKFTEILDDIEEVLNAQEVFPEILQPRTVGESAQKVLPDSRLPR